MLFLGLAANFSLKDQLRHLFTLGSKNSSAKLRSALAKHYDAKPSSIALYQNGRTALAVGLQMLSLPPKTEVIINGFTCYAVVQAIIAADLTPVYADISLANLNFSAATLAATLHRHPAAKVLIIQNTFGLPADLSAIVALAAKHDLTIVEDLAHGIGGRYPDGREYGTVGTFSILSFGKGKAVDTVTGGALIMRDSTRPVSQPSLSPSFAAQLRARLYPALCLLPRALFSLRLALLAKIYLALLFKIHLITRSADADIDPSRRLGAWQSALLLDKIKRNAFSTGRPPREFYLVKNRAAVLKKLVAAGYYFPDFWYEKPISPARYYQKANFSPTDCPHAVIAADHIINLPTHYKPHRLDCARAIIEGNRYD